MLCKHIFCLSGCSFMPDNVRFYAKIQTLKLNLAVMFYFLNVFLEIKCKRVLKMQWAKNLNVQLKYK